jgi:hypothetical protein
VLLAEGKVFVANRGGVYYALGQHDRQVAWQRDLGVPVLMSSSMEAGASVGTLTTRPVRFSGKHLFVNVDCPEGKLCAEILNDQGQVIGPFSAVNCQPVSADKTLQAVRWQDAEDLSAVSGRPVRFRFQLTNGKLYAFWVSPTPDGASHGYLAAGGPGYPGPVDTIGMVPR